MIHIDFADFHEMAEFARQLLGIREEITQPASAVTPAPAPAPAVQPAPVQAAPVQSVPVQATAPTAAPAAVPTAVQAAQPSSPAAVPTAAAGYTLDDLAVAGMSLMDSGRQADLHQLLASFGVEALPALPPAQYGAFATALRGMGAKI